MALAPRLAEGKPPWRDDAAWLAAVEGWIREAANAAAQPDHVVYLEEDVRLTKKIRTGTG